MSRETKKQRAARLKGYAEAERIKREHAELLASTPIERTCWCDTCDVCLRWHGADQLRMGAGLERAYELWEAADEQGRAFIERRQPWLRDYLRVRGAYLAELQSQGHGT